MEQELSSWIESGRAKGACISGFVIKVKALEIMRESCQRENLLKRITTSERDLADNSIKAILNI
jgi:hypothetical protein